MGLIPGPENIFHSWILSKIKYLLLMKYNAKIYTDIEAVFIKDLSFSSLHLLYLYFICILLLFMKRGLYVV